MTSVLEVMREAGVNEGALEGCTPKKRRECRRFFWHTMSVLNEMPAWVVAMQDAGHTVEVWTPLWKAWLYQTFPTMPRFKRWLLGYVRIPT